MQRFKKFKEGDTRYVWTCLNRHTDVCEHFNCRGTECKDFSCREDCAVDKQFLRRKDNGHC